jgi:ribose-phosphate pyrophosphokinase
MLVIEGPSGNGIGKSIASSLGCDFLESLHTIFPDGESEVGITAPVEGKDVVIVQSTCPMPDKRLIELVLLANEAKRQKARSICAVVPYLAYSRQDQRFEEKGNAVSIYTILEMLNFAGISTMVTAAPHNSESLKAFNGRMIVADAITPLANEVKKDLSKPFVLAPDKDALYIAKRFAEVLGCGYTYIKKQRNKLTGEVKILEAPKDVDFKDKELVIVDDMISTGGTIVQAAQFAHANGAGRIVAAAVHLVMADGAYERMRGAGVDAVYGTNTIPYDRARAHTVDISDAIAAAIRSKAAPTKA